MCALRRLENPVWLISLALQKLPGGGTQLFFFLVDVWVVYGSAKTCFSQDMFLPRHVSPKTCFSQDTFLPRHVSPKTRFSQDTFLSRHVSPKTRFSQDTFLPRHVSLKTRQGNANDEGNENIAFYFFVLYYYSLIYQPHLRYFALGTRFFNQSVFSCTVQ